MNYVEPHMAIKIQSSLSEINTNIVETKNLVPVSKKQFDGDDLTLEDTKPDINLNFSSLSNSSAFFKRNSEDNYKIELLLVHTKGYIFRTTAKDISLTGTYNERIVPHEYHNCAFDLIIINNLSKDNLRLERITLRSQIVSNDGILYIQYLNPSKNQICLLREILNEYRNLYQKLSTK